MDDVLKVTLWGYELDYSGLGQGSVNCRFGEGNESTSFMTDDKFFKLNKIGLISQTHLLLFYLMYYSGDMFRLSI